MYCEVKESFNKKYSTWIIAYCIDNNSWFTTNERNFYYEYPDEFQCENDARNYFRQNIKDFVNIQNPMNHWNKNEIILETTKNIELYEIKEINGNCCCVHNRTVNK
ncbi:conserved protein of unknown function [Ruminococcaceae bacterium BL-6]|nr:conserved protein of unknown function [Ruminococcaceae bacterium BL-6]